MHHTLKGDDMSRQIWDRESQKEYRRIFKEYKREGFDELEARRLAKQEVNEIMEDKIDFAEELYKTALKDLT
jgi:hypothetical protein|tara:strand:+ start:805 stop:1020 length:216 start_codon:yes stop_codon:yes gene_type:complete